MTTSLISGRPLTRQISRGRALAASWSQHFVSGKALSDPDYTLASAQCLSWLMGLVGDPKLAPGVTETIGRVLECEFVSLEFQSDRQTPVEVWNFGTLPQCFYVHLERGRDFARDTGLAALAEIDGGRGLMCVPIRGWSSPRVIALMVCARTGAKFSRQDGAFVSQVATPGVNLLLGSTAPAAQSRLSPGRRPTRTLSRSLARPTPLKRPAQNKPEKRTQPLSSKALFHADDDQPTATFNRAG